MEEITANSNMFSLEEEEEESTESSSMFSELKQHCVMLLSQLQNPNTNTNSSLTQLLHLLQRATPQSIQPFLDYTLFPLLLLFDEAVNCRSSKNFNFKESPVEFSTFGNTRKFSDSAAETVVLCLEEVLNKCHIGSVDQMVVILKKLTLGALLSPTEASEEFREGVIRCFKALLLNLCPCSDGSCQCKQIEDSLLSHEQELQCPVPQASKYSLIKGQCLLGFLQSEAASAAVGHWLSLLLKAADSEASRGQRGSSQVRVEALTTLRVLVAKVGTADALAFYLPGVVSQIGKVLHVSRTMISGAAGSAKALDQALRALAEYLSIVLQAHGDSTFTCEASMNDVSGLRSKEKPLASYIEELRHLTIKNQTKEGAVKDSTESFDVGSATSSGNDINSDIKSKSLRVERTADWFANTAAHVNKLLSATLPQLCVHSSEQVRVALVATVQLLLSKCNYALRESRLMLLECLFVLVSDDSEEVSSKAQTAFGCLVSSREKHQIEHDIAELLGRLVEKLPQVVLRDDEALALSHARKLLVVTYFCGPQLIADNLLHSHVAAVSFLDVFTLCLSQNSVFAGSLNKLASTRTSSTGFMSSISEIKAITSSAREDSDLVGFQNRKASRSYEHVSNDFELPSMPPWFGYLGSQKLYQALAGILRLVSLYIFTDSRSEGSLSLFIDILLGHFRKLISELRTKEYHNDSWQSWYNRTGSGNLVRQACTAACILNEMVFGLSDQAVNNFARMFQTSQIQNGSGVTFGYKDALTELQNQKTHLSRGARSHLADLIGSILHEYLSPELWDLPLGFSSSLQKTEEDGNISLHSFTDNQMLHQVIIEGIGVFNISLGKQFSSCGFLHSSLYILLENVICSHFQVRKASDSVLHAISATQGYPNVGHLVLANSDYIIDSICRQLRHLDLNPHVPNVLSAMLSYIGVADKILPLLEEPMRAVSAELEILGRRQHPDLTVSFMKAVAEIAKAAKHEACKLPDQAESYKMEVNGKMLNAEKRTGKSFRSDAEDTMETENTGSDTPGEIYLHDAETLESEWETVLLRLNDSRRYRRIVGSIAGSCLVAVTPLIASDDPEACLAALDVVEAGITVLSRVEAAYKHEAETKETVRLVIESCSFYNLLDTLSTADDDETGENRMLPAMNKIWPFLVACFQNKNLVAIRRCCKTISHVVQVGGGEFFSRRFHTDGNHFWKLLSTSPFQNKTLAKQERNLLQLPYRRSPSSEEPVAEISNLKVQVAILNMISDVSSSKRSAPALEAVFKKVSGMVIGIACSGIKGLQESSINALVGLASVDPDLIWLLLADVYYSRKKDHPSPPSAELPEVSEVLPAPLSAKEYLYVLYGGKTYGFDIDISSVETVFKALHSRVFTAQIMYI